MPTGLDEFRDVKDTDAVGVGSVAQVVSNRMVPPADRRVEHTANSAAPASTTALESVFTMVFTSSIPERFGMTMSIIVIVGCSS